MPSGQSRDKYCCLPVTKLSFIIVLEPDTHHAKKELLLGFSCLRIVTFKSVWKWDWEMHKAVCKFSQCLGGANAPVWSLRPHHLPQGNRTRECCFVLHHKGSVSLLCIQPSLLNSNHTVSAPSFNQNKKWPPWQSLWTDCRNRNRAFHSDAHHYLIQQPVGIKISCCQNLFFFGWRPKSFLSPVGSVTPCPHTVTPGGSARMWKQWSSAGTSLNHSFFSWFPELLFQSSSRELILMF